MRTLLSIVLLAAFSSPAIGVDGVLEINQASVSGPAGTLHEITESGSYVLTGNLVAPENHNGILISAEDVTLDLNGFSISAGGASGALLDGIRVVSDNVEVRNGTLRGFGRAGALTEGNETRFLGLRALNNQFFGIVSSSNNGARIEGCTVMNNSAGIRVFSPGSLVLGNVVVGNSGPGLQVTGTVGLGHNTLSDNTADPQISGGTPIACNLVESTLVCPP